MKHFLCLFFFLITIHGAAISRPFSYTSPPEALPAISPKATPPGTSPSAAQVTVNGKVTDAEGGPITGVSVAVPGTTIGTSTDASGNYSLQVAEDASLTFSFLGFKPQTVAVNGRTSIDVVLELDAVALEQTVVVAYGTQKKINLTGAVSQIGGEVLEDRPAPSVARLLQGTLPNLNLRMRDGSPTRQPNFNIRGATSIGAGGSALVLIDGVEGDPSLLNPGDIESVSMLKDASSAAVYGSRAAFGVLLITTKSAKKGQSNINIRVNQSINQRTVVPNLVTNGYEWAKNFDEAFFGWYDYKTHATSVNSVFPFSLDYLERLRQNSLDPNAPDVVYNESLGRYEYFGNTDWFDLLHEDMNPSTEAAISISGGSEKASFYVSGMYYHQGGIFRFSPDEFDKFNVRAKGEVNLNSWLTLRNNMDMSTYSYDYPLLANGDGNIWRYLNVQGFPMAVLNNPDGTYTHIGAYTVGPFVGENGFRKQQRFFVRTTPSLTAKPFGELLTLKADFTYSRDFDKNKRVNNYIYYSNSPGQLDRFGNSLLRHDSRETAYWGSNITAELKPNTGEDHELSFLAGYNVEHSQRENIGVDRDGLLVPDKPDLNLTNGLNYSASGGGLDWAYLGLFYRAKYSYQNKYLLELNGRYDGSSKFPTDQRYGFFPSVSAGWNIAEEAFMDKTDNWLQQFKLRASYGSLGNGNVDPYRYMQVMSVGETSVILNGVQKGYTYVPGVIPAGLTWETATTFNVGLDLEMLRSRLTASFDWYNRETTDMFTRGQPLPNVFGAAVPSGNYADMRTKGWELTLGWRDEFNLGGSPFSYSFNGSLWDNQSEIIRFNNPERLLGSHYVGQQLGEIWGYETLGFFTSEEDIANHADQDFLRNSNNNILLPGDLKFADLNGDDVINQGDNTVDNPGDRRIIGNNTPRYQFGFTLSGNWKGFGLSAFFQGIAKRDWYFPREADLFWGPYNRPYGFQPVKLMENIWSEENPNAYFPRFRGYMALGDNRSLGAAQTRYLQDASYIRLKSLSLDYALPAELLKKAGISQARIFLTGQNIFTLSGLFKHTENFDPEVIEDPIGDETNGYGQGDAYPMLKSYTLGLSLTF